MIIIIDGKEESFDGSKGEIIIPECKEAILKLVEKKDIFFSKLTIPEGVTGILPGAISHLAKATNPTTGVEEEKESIEEIIKVEIPTSLQEIWREDDEVLQEELSFLGHLIEASIPSDLEYMLKPSFDTIHSRSYLPSSHIWTMARDLSGFVSLATSGERTIYRKSKNLDGVNGIMIEVNQIPYIERVLPDNFSGYIILQNATQEQQKILEKILESKQMAKRGIEVVCINQIYHKGEDKFTGISTDDVAFNDGVPDVFCAGNGLLKRIKIGKDSRKIGKYAFADCTGLEWALVEEGITEIGDGSFAGCTSLTTVILPESLRKIGKGAFKNCIALKEIVIPEGVKVLDVSVFENCINLEKITIPSSVKIIGQSALKGCRKLEIIKIPDSVEEIGESAFENCTELQSAEIGNGVKNINNRAFKGCKALNAVLFNPQNCSVERIGDSCFEGCSALKEFSLPKVKKKQQVIGNKAFYGCNELTQVMIMGVTEIGKSAFRNCSNLSEVVFGDELEILEDMTFMGCSSLLEINIPESIEKIGESSFNGCKKLSKVVFSKNSKLKEISYGSFRECSSLKTIVLPGRVEIIGDSAFDGCSSISSITIPSKTKKIEDRAFFGCTSLQQINFPESIVEIGDIAFGRCKELKEIHIHKSSIKGLSRAAFDGDNGEKDDNKTTLVIHIIENDKEYYVINGEIIMKGRDFSKQIGKMYVSELSAGLEDAATEVYGDGAVEDLPDGFEQHGGVVEVTQHAKEESSVFGEIIDTVAEARREKKVTNALIAASEGQAEKKYSLAGILETLKKHRLERKNKKKKEDPGDETPSL